MEFPSTQASAVFTSHRDVRIQSDDGSACAEIEAGKPTRLPNRLFPAAIAAGLVPESPEQFASAPATAAPAAPRSAPTQEQIVASGLIEACKQLIARGDKNDFTPKSGFPRTAAAKKLVDFDFTANDLRVAFEQAMHEVEHDGDDSPQHSESSDDAS